MNLFDRIQFTAQGQRSKLDSIEYQKSIKSNLLRKVSAVNWIRLKIKINQIQFTAQGQRSKMDWIENQNQSNPIYCARSAQ